MKLCEDVELLCLAVRFFKHIALQLGKHAAILPIFHTGRGVQTNVFSVRGTNRREMLLLQVSVNLLVGPFNTVLL